jgi:hypothetical protein
MLPMCEWTRWQALEGTCGKPRSDLGEHVGMQTAVSQLTATLLSQQGPEMHRKG